VFGQPQSILFIDRQTSRLVRQHSVAASSAKVIGNGFVIHFEDKYGNNRYGWQLKKLSSSTRAAVQPIRCELRKRNLRAISIYVNSVINKYQRWYDQLIERARNRVIDGYVEVHHVIPRSLGGTNEPNNLVRLTAREHLIAHMLLPRFVEQPEKMWAALFCMMNMGEVKVTGKLYEQARIEFARADSQRKKGRPNPALKGRPSPHRGRKLSEEHKAKISARMKGRVHTEHHRLNNSLSNKGRVPWNKGKKKASPLLS